MTALPQASDDELAVAMYRAAEVHPDECLRLWTAVLAEAWRQAFHLHFNETLKDLDAARRWFGSRDFCLVCGMVDLDPDDVMAAFRRAVAEGAARPSRRQERRT